MECGSIEALDYILSCEAQGLKQLPLRAKDRSTRYCSASLMGIAQSTMRKERDSLHVVTVSLTASDEKELCVVEVSACTAISSAVEKVDSKATHSV